jgi:hypothetical protein
MVERVFYFGGWPPSESAIGRLVKKKKWGTPFSFSANVRAPTRYTDPLETLATRQKFTWTENNLCKQGG